MHFIPRILEKDQVMTVQADASVAFALMEQIGTKENIYRSLVTLFQKEMQINYCIIVLHNVNNAQISVMRSFCKQVHDTIR